MNSEERIDFNCKFFLACTNRFCHGFFSTQTKSLASNIVLSSKALITQLHIPHLLSETCSNRAIMFRLFTREDIRILISRT